MATYVCEKCNYSTNIQCNMLKHYRTKKHTGVQEPKREIVCNTCMRTFKTNYTLLRHQTGVCNNNNVADNANNDTNNNENTDTQSIKKKNDKLAADMIYQLMEQNKELRDLLLAQTDQLESIVKNAEQQISDKLEKHMQLVVANPSRKKRDAAPTTVTNNNTLNNTNNFNINVFLNVNCKDALNLTDFMETIKIEVEDVEKLGEVGFADGISRIIIGALENLDLNKRPIHCKKKTVYVKDEDKWSEDEKRQQIMRLVRNVSQHNLRVFMNKCMGADRMDTESPDYDKQVALMRQVNGGKYRDANERDAVRKIEEFAQLYEQTLINCDFTKAELDDLERKMCGEIGIKI